MATTTPPQVSTSQRPAANKWVIAGTVVLGSFVSVMDISIVNVAMPQMIGTFGVSLESITWVAVSYSIAEIILVTMAAWLSMLLGRKRFFIFSFVLFTIASMLCGAARSLEMMIIARILQGIGGGGLIPVAQAIMLETFPERERGMAMALYSMAVVLAPATGPVVGGWLTDEYGWPWIFYINLPLGILGIFLAINVLADPPYLRRTLARIDVVGIILLAVGLTALQIMLEQGPRDNWFESAFILRVTVLAGVSLVVLVIWELWIEEPVVNLRVLSNIQFTAGTCLGLIFGITLFGSIFILPLFLQRLRGYSVLASGMALLPRSLIMLVVTPIGGRLYNHVDSRLLIGGGIAMMIWSYWEMAYFNLDVGWLEMMPALLISGAGMSFMFGTMSAAVMRTMPLQLLTAASGLFVLARRIGGNIGYALVSSQVEQRTAFHRARLVDYVTPYDVNVQQTLDNLSGRLASSGLPPGSAEDSAIAMLNGTVNRHATIMAYNDVFWIMALLTLISLPFLICMGGRKSASPAAGGRSH